LRRLGVEALGIQLRALSDFECPSLLTPPIAKCVSTIRALRARQSQGVSRVTGTIAGFQGQSQGQLKAERGIGFEEIVFHIERGDLLDILEHPNQERYGGQRIFVVRRDDHVYLVPFVEDDTSVFLKTIIPSRKATKQYLHEEPDDDEA
jgi:hypothetical protein